MRTTQWKGLALFCAVAMVMAVLWVVAPAFADHGHHRHPGHQKMRKVVCMLMADEKGDKDEPDFPDIGCSP